MLDPREARTVIQLSPPGVCEARTLAPERVRHQHIGGGMDGLHRSNNIQRTEPSRIVRMDHLHMLNPMTKRGQMVFLLIIP
jgi:hypothetical protein